ncbi:MAG: cytochrome C oxidase subunit IV family protein [Bacteroidota bacterium]
MSSHEEHGHILPEAEYKAGVKDVGKWIIILGVVTVVEVLFAIAWMEWFKLPKRPLNIILIFMSLFKAVSIMAVFMHVKHEKKGFILTIAIPFLFLIWAIIAFLWEGNCWRHYQELINYF